MKQKVTNSLLHAVRIAMRTATALTVLLLLTASAFAQNQCNAHFQFYLGVNPDSAHFYSATTVSNARFLWTFGDGDSSDAAIPWHFYRSAGTKTVCLTVTDSGASGKCSDTWCDTIHIPGLPPPVCTAIFQFYFGTNPDSVHFYASTAGSPTKYSWSFGDGTSSTVSNPWHFYNDTGIKYVCLTVTDSVAGGKCTDTRCDTIHIHGLPPPVCNAEFVHYPSVTNIDSIHFYPTAITNTAGIKFYWSFGDGTHSTQFNPWHLYTDSGNKTVCLMVTDSTATGKCTATWCDTIHIAGLPKPVCNAKFQFYTLNNPDSVHFYTYSDTTTTKFSWNFGDGSAGSDNPFPWHFFTHGGTFDVCLTVSDSTAHGKCTDTWCDSIHIQGVPPPVCNAKFSYYSLTGNADSVHFYTSTNSAAGIKYTWLFGDGSANSHNADPWHLYAGSGAYYVCLYVTDSTAGGTCSAYACDSIHIIAPPPPCNAHFTTVAARSNANIIYFIGAQNPPGTIYSWNFGDNSSLGSDSITSHTYANSGTYWVCLTVANTRAGCTQTWCDSVHVTGPPPPSCNAHFVFYSIKSNADSVHFYVTPANATNAKYNWNFGDGDSSANADPWHLFMHPGPYNVCLTVTDSTSGGTCTASLCDTVHIVGPPPPTCNAHFQFYSLHNPDSVHFYPSSTVATSTTAYLWTFGDNSNSSTDRYPWHFFQQSGVYDVCLTVTDSTAGGKCSDTWCDSVHIMPLPPPACNAHFSHTSVNSINTVIHFNPAPNVPGTFYSWNFGDGSPLSSDVDPTHTYANSGGYSVCLTVTDSANGGVVCTANWCDTIQVGVRNNPCNAHFDFRFGYSISVFYFIHAPNAPGTTYSWDFGDGGKSSDANPLHEFANPGTYWVCLTVDNSAAGCTATWCDSVYVQGAPPRICNSNFYFKPGNTAHGLYFFSAPNSPSTIYLWTFGDGDSSTLPDPFHQYAAAGSYKVCLTVTDTIALCSDMRCLTLGPLRLAEGGSTSDGQSNEVTASIYPNPMAADAILHIENMSGAVTFSMYDNVGRLVSAMGNLTNGDFNFSKEGLSAGVYIYQVIDANNNVIRGKLIVQ